METTFNNIADFKNALASDTDLQNAFKTDPAAAAKNIQLSSTPLDYDKWIYRIVVIALSASILSIIIGILFSGSANPPATLTAIGSAAIGALTGLLAPSPKSAKQ